MIKLNSNYLDRPYADIELNKGEYNYNSYNINATSDYYSYFYNNLFSYDANTKKYSLNTNSKEKFGFDYSFLALHDSVLLNNIALNNKCIIYKRIVKSTGLGYISWKNWFSQLYLQNKKLLNIINQNKLTLPNDNSKSVLDTSTINLLLSLSPDQQSFSYNYLSKELNLTKENIEIILNNSYYLNGYSDKSIFNTYLESNPNEPFILNFQAIQNLRDYNIDKDKNLDITGDVSESDYSKKQTTQNFKQIIQKTGISMNIKSSFADTAHIDLFEGRSLISRDLFLDDTLDQQNKLSNYNSNYIDINVSKFVDIILDNSSFNLGMHLQLEKANEAVTNLVKEIKDDTTGAIKGIGKIIKGIVKFLPGGSLVTAINDAVATLAGISQGISTSSKALSNLGNFSESVKNTLESSLQNGIKIAKSGSKSVGLTSQSSSLTDSFNTGVGLSGISDILGGITQIVQSGTGLYEQMQEFRGADNDVGQTSVKYVNWNNLTQVVKSETTIQFYEDTLRFTFSLGQFGIFNTVEEVIKPCLNLLALVEPSKIDFNKLFGPYFTIESLIMKSGLGDNISSFARSFLKGDTQIESSVFMKDFWDISIGPGIHFYNCMFYDLEITFSDDKDQNGLPIKATCTLKFRSQTPKSILSNYTSQVSFRFGPDINLIDLYNSIPNTIKELENDSWKNSVLSNDLSMMTKRNTLFLTKQGTSISDNNSIIKKEINKTIQYRLGFYTTGHSYSEPDKEETELDNMSTRIFTTNIKNLIYDIDDYFYKFDVKYNIKTNNYSKNIEFYIEPLLRYAKNYININNIPLNKYSQEEITLAIVYPVRKISNKLSTIYINNKKTNCEGEAVIFPKNNNKEYIKNILKMYNTNNSFFSLNSYDIDTPIKSFYALSYYINNNNPSNLSPSNLTCSISRYKKELNEYKELQNTERNENIEYYLFDDDKDKLDVNDNGYSGFYIKTLCDKTSTNKIYLSDIFLMYDFLRLTNSVKSNNLNYVAGLNVTEDENIFYNKNRQSNVKIKFDNDGKAKDDVFFSNNSNYLKRTKILDKYVLATTKCTKYENIYNSYTYGFKLSPYNSSFLDIYKEEIENTNTNDNNNIENKETSENENKESSVNTNTGSDSGFIDITDFVKSNLLKTSDSITVSYQTLLNNDLKTILPAKNIESHSFLSMYENNYKLKVINAIQSFRNSNNIPVDENNNKYTYTLSVLPTSTDDDFSMFFEWNINSKYIEISNEG